MMSWFRFRQARQVLSELERKTARSGFCKRRKNCSRAGSSKDKGVSFCISESGKSFIWGKDSNEDFPIREYRVILMSHKSEFLGLFKWWKEFSRSSKVTMLRGEILRLNF